jgi:hypothetical protein
MTVEEEHTGATGGRTTGGWRRPDRLVLAFDLGATALFALEGATRAVDRA